MRAGVSVVAAAVGAILALTPTAAACPFCDGGPSAVNEVKAAVFGDDFWAHLLCTAAPFGVFLAVAALVHFGLPFPRGRAARQTDQAAGVDLAASAPNGGAG